MVTGWKAISQVTGFSRNTIKKLVDMEGFPLQTIASKPVTTHQAINSWFVARMKRQGSSAFEGMSSDEVFDHIAL